MQRQKPMQSAMIATENGSEMRQETIAALISTKSIAKSRPNPVQSFFELTKVEACPGRILSAR